jgi:hypothetical protein
VAWYSTPRSVPARDCSQPSEGATPPAVSPIHIVVNDDPSEYKLNPRGRIAVLADDPIVREHSRRRLQHRHAHGGREGER